MLSPNASGNKPKIVAEAVNITGVILVLPASTMASNTGTPFALSKSVNSTRRIPFLTTIPARAMIPTPLMTIENSILNTENPINTPIMLNRISVRIINGLLMELNCKTRIIIISRREAIIAQPRKAEVSACSSCEPVIFIVTDSGEGKFFKAF